MPVMSLADIGGWNHRATIDAQLAHVRGAVGAGEGYAAVMARGSRARGRMRKVGELLSRAGYKAGWTPVEDGRATLLIVVTDDQKLEIRPSHRWS